MEPDGYKDFNLFYLHKMERMIEFSVRRHSQTFLNNACFEC